MGRLGTPTHVVAPARTELDGHWLQAARAAWIIAAILAVGFSIAFVPVTYAENQTVCTAGDECPYWQLVPKDMEALGELGLSASFYAAYTLVTDMIYMLGFWAIGAVIFWKNSHDRVALFCSFMLVTFGASITVNPAADIYPVLDLLSSFLGFLGYVSFYAFFYLFPDGRFVPHWTRWALIALALYEACLGFAPDDSPLDPAVWPPLLPGALIPGLFATMVFAQLYRYWRVSGPVERQQTKWIVFGLTAALTGAMAPVVFTDVFPTLLRAGVPNVLYVLTEATVSTFSLLLIPVSIGIAIMRYRLWDIDLIINRTLVYGTLTASVVGIYALLVGSLASLLQAPRDNFLISLLAAGFVAVLFAPLRERLQRGVNRLMYGERDDPYRVLSHLGKRLEATLAQGAVLPTIVETVASALKLPYVAIAMKQEDGFKVAAAYGSPAGEPTVLPLTYGAETIGQLTLVPRAPGEGFSAADWRLLEDLARNAEVAVHAVRLTADLRRSRERLVSAREEERRRLRRDMHDGLGPTLGSLHLGLDVSLKLLKSNPLEAEKLLYRLKAQTQDAVADIRRLVYGLRPPALDDLGLVPAIRQQASNHGHLADDLPGEAAGEANRKDGLILLVEAPKTLPPLPAAVEVACYRIALEAITNVARHARASSCRIYLSHDAAKSELRLEVIDDGIGLPEDRRAGVGLSSMAERAEELGGTLSIEPVPTGGTRVVARLPLLAEGEG